MENNVGEDLALMKVAAGNRIALGTDVCGILNIKKGDKVVLYRNSSGEVAIRKSTRPDGGVASV